MTSFSSNRHHQRIFSVQSLRPAGCEALRSTVMCLIGAISLNRFNSKPQTFPIREGASKVLRAVSRIKILEYFIRVVFFSFHAWRTY